MMPVLFVALAALGDPDLPRWLSEEQASTPEKPEAQKPAAPAPPLRPDEPSWWIGPRFGGFDPQDGTANFLLGFQARWQPLPWLGGEFALDFTHTRAAGGNIQLDVIPVQFSVVATLPLEGSVRPFALAGLGWENMRAYYAGPLGFLSTYTHAGFEGHVGAGIDWVVSPGATMDLDARYLFVDEPAGLRGARLDSWIVTLGVNLRVS